MKETSTACPSRSFVQRKKRHFRIRHCEVHFTAIVFFWPGALLEREQANCDWRGAPFKVVVQLHHSVT